MMHPLFLLLISFLLCSRLNAFAPILRRECQSPFRRLASSSLRAADGAPQYDKIDGVLHEVEKLAEGSFLLHVQLADDDGSVRLDYQPGHVLALELEDRSSDNDDWNEDTKKNGGWMRGPYTVSRCTERSLDVLVRVVGKKSRAMVESPPGTPVRFGGKFKVPILEGISKQDTRKVILVSTGVGVGPCVGAIELAMKDESFPPIALLASYREPKDVVYQDNLDQLASLYSSKFQWKPIITSETGRLSSCQETLQKMLPDNMSIPDTHFHLIGNGQMVNEWKQGLDKAGVAVERVTTEQYFNHKAEPNATAIENIAAVVLACAAVVA